MKGGCKEDTQKSFLNENDPMTNLKEFSGRDIDTFWGDVGDLVAVFNSQVIKFSYVKGILDLFCILISPGYAPDWIVREWI